MRNDVNGFNTDMKAQFGRDLLQARLRRVERDDFDARAKV